jgi:choline-sulfatase
MADRPNLLVILCDELRWAEVGCYGHPVVRTPNLDALAQEGMRCETAISNAPVCVAARSVVLSGQYARSCTGTPNNTALRFNADDRSRSGWLFEAYAPPTRVAFPNATLPELLRDAGYHTRTIGKWHVDAWPHHLGFDHYVIPRAHHAHSAQLFTENGGPEFCPPGFSVDFEAERFEQFVSNEQSARPWFCYYNISPPHMPLADMPERYLTMYDPADVVLRANVPQPFDDAAHADTFRTYRWDYRHYLNRMPHADELPEGFGLRELTALYYGAITWVDDTVGRILAALEATGQADDTLVVFTSDHGDNFGSHGLFGKSHLIDESCRIPMLFRGPGVSKGVATRAVPSLVDLAATLLTAAGCDVPGHLQGTALDGMLAGGQGPSHAIIETTPDGCGIRTPTHLLGRPWDGGMRRRTLAAPPHRFHDVRADPLQLETCQDLATLRSLDTTLSQWNTVTPWMARDLR